MIINLKKSHHLWVPGQPWPADWLYIGRKNKWLGLEASKWGNPFVLHKEMDRESVLHKYQQYLVRNLMLMADLHEIDNKVLVCYCWPKKCHGTVLQHLRTLQLKDNILQKLTVLESINKELDFLGI